MERSCQESGEAAAVGVRLMVLDYLLLHLNGSRSPRTIVLREKEAAAGQ